MAPNDWTEYKLLVLAELDRLDDNCVKLRDCVETMEKKCVRHYGSERRAMARWKFWTILATTLAAVSVAVVDIIMRLVG